MPRGHNEYSSPVGPQRGRVIYHVSSRTEQHCNMHIITVCRHRPRFHKVRKTVEQHRENNDAHNEGSIRTHQAHHNTLGSLAFISLPARASLLLNSDINRFYSTTILPSHHRET